MSKLNANTFLVKSVSALTIIFTGFSGFGTQAAQAMEQSCDVETSTVLIGCDFRDRDLSGRIFTDFTIANSDFSGANLQSANLQGVNLTSNIFSSSTSLQNANLSRANLSGLNLSGVSLTGAYLKNSNVSEANLSGANLTNADLTDANMNTANLVNAVLWGTNVLNTDFSNSEFSGVSSQNLMNSPTVLPVNWKLIAGYLFGPKANLANAYLNGQNLSALDLSGAIFTGAHLNNANLSGSKLIGANLTNASLASADLTTTDFTAADLTGVILTGAYINMTNFQNATLINVQRECIEWEYCRNFYWYGWNLESFNRNVGFQHANLDGVKSGGFPQHVTYFNNWSDAYYCTVYNYYWACDRRQYRQMPLPSGWVNRNGVLLGPAANLSGGNFANQDFSGLTLSSANFYNTHLTGANFSNSNVTNANFSGKDLRNANFTNANLTSANFAGANLDGVNFNNATLTGANLSGTNLSATSLNYVVSGQIIGETSGLPVGWKLINGHLVGRTAGLTGADLSGSNLSGMDLSSSNLSSANLSASNLGNVVLTGANINGANFSGSELAGLTSGSLQGGGPQLPEKWNLVRGYLVGPKANLVGAQLSSLTLTGWDFSGANLSGSNLTSSNFDSASFVGANLTNVGFTSSDLRSVNFTDANLTGVNMNNAYVYSTNFTRAKLVNIVRGFTCLDWWNSCYYGYDNYRRSDSNDPRNSFVNVTLTGVIVRNFSGPGYNFSANLPEGWTLRHGIFFGPSADLSGLSLRQLDLTNLNLSSANLSGVDLLSSNLAGSDLSSAILAGVQSRALTGAPVLPSGWILANGTLIGAGAQAANSTLSGLDLQGLDLSGIDLSNSNLTGANLRGANLSGANLRNANLSGADISGANLTLTDLNGVVFGELIANDVVGSPINIPSGWIMQDGKFVGTIFLSNVSVSGALIIGEELTATFSSSPSSVTYAYQWFRNGVAIEGGTDRTYRIGVDDMGSRLSVQLSAAKDNFMSASAVSAELYISNILPYLTNMSVQGQAAKGGQLSMSFAGHVSFSNLSYQVSRDGGSTWTNIGGALYNIQFTDLGGDLRFRVVQSAPGYVTQTTEFDAVAVQASYSLPGFSMGSIDGANSGSSIQGGAKVGSVLKATKSAWANGTRVTGFWWSSKGYSVSNKLTYKSMPQDIGADLVYMEVGVSPTGETKYRMSTSVNVVPNQFDNSSKPNLIGATTIASRIKAAVTTSWSSGAKYSYQWLANGEVIPGATGVTYTVTADDVDSALSVRVCATKLSFAEKCEESLPTAIISKSEINSSSKPTHRLTATRSGKQLSVSLGKWLTGVTFKYEWLRDGEVLLGEDKATYSFKPEDNGHTMSVRVTGSKAGYFDLARTSDSKVYK